jgi:hypothetical protein
LWFCWFLNVFAFVGSFSMLFFRFHLGWDNFHPFNRHRSSGFQRIWNMSIPSNYVNELPICVCRSNSDMLERQMYHWILPWKS